MAEMMQFANREDFRLWLSENALSDSGIWIVFSKSKTDRGMTAAEALEEALCFGWIDGQMQKIDDSSYKKYFKQRAKTADWSEKNRKLAQKLEESGQMTDFGRAKIEYAKANGHWDVVKPTLSDDQLAEFDKMVKDFPAAYGNWAKMPPSMRRGYTGSYFLGTKTEDGRKKRFAEIIRRLELNLNPMESMKKALETLQEDK